MNYAHLLNRLLAAEDLPFAEMSELMQHIMGGQLTPAQIAAVLIALRIKGETVNEIAAAATVMRELSSKVSVKKTGHLIDTCGTGGDSMQTFNTAGARYPAPAAARTCWKNSA
jgi:anthranilate phosphoribosyltransferase